MSIFDVQPPAWLTAIAKPADTSVAAKDIGMGLAAGINAAQLATSKENQALPEEQRKTWLQEIPQGLNEARLNMLDPMWKLKVEQQALNMKGQEAQLSAQMEHNKWQAQEHNWWLEEAPNVAKYMTDPNAPLPTVKSTQGIQALSNAIKMHVNKDSATDFSDTVNELRKLDPVKAQRYAPFIGKPIPPQVYQQLGADLETARKEHPQPKEAFGKLLQDRNDAYARGDMTQVKFFDAKIQEEISKKGFHGHIGYDDQGRVIVDFGQGDEPSRTPVPTVAMKTQAQEATVHYQNAIELINYLQKNMTEAHVGFKGAAGEILFDRILEQFVPGSANQQRVSVRKTLHALRESLMRKISDETSAGRFSQADREEISRMLPETDVFESKADADYAMSRIKEILTDRVRAYSTAQGTLPPVWTLSEDEMLAAVAAGAEAIKRGVKPDSEEFRAKYLTPEQAQAAWDKYHQQQK